MNTDTDKNKIIHWDYAALYARFSRYKNRILLVFLAALTLTAFIEFVAWGLARRTFVFYTGSNGAVTVEQRMLRLPRGNVISGKNTASSRSQASRVNQVSRRSLRVSGNREVNITRYVEEALLGPVSPDSLPLFPRETRLLSLLYRDGVVYVDLSEDAALPPAESVWAQDSEVLRNLVTLHSGMKRNFPYIKDIRFFIAGKTAYPDQFRIAGGSLKSGI